MLSYFHRKIKLKSKKGGLLSIILEAKEDI